MGLHQVQLVTPLSGKPRWVVPTAVADVAAAANKEVEAYILASNATSEAAHRPLTEQAAIVRIAINAAKTSRWKGAADMLLSRVAKGYEWSRGMLAKQPGGWASTARPPNAEGFRAVKEGFKSMMPGVSYFNPTAMPGKEAVKRLLEKRWEEDGLGWIGPWPGIDPVHLIVQDKISSLNKIYTPEEVMAVIYQDSPAIATPIIISIVGALVAAYLVRKL